MNEPSGQPVTAGGVTADTSLAAAPEDMSTEEVIAALHALRREIGRGKKSDDVMSIREMIEEGRR